MRSLKSVRGFAIVVLPGRSVLLSVFAVLWALVAPAWAAAASADRVLASVPRATPVAAGGRTVAWSAFRPDRDRYFLTAYRGGRVLSLGASRAIPFDANVGLSSGTTVVTFSACKKEAPRAGRVLYSYGRGSGCTLRQWRSDLGRVVAIGGAHVRGASETMPSVNGKRIAFVRTTADRRTSIVIKSYQDFRARRTLLEIPVRTALGARPVSLDLSGMRVASLFVGVPAPGGGRPTIEVTVAGELRPVAATASTESVERLVTAPDLVHGRTYFAVSALSNGAASSFAVQGPLGTPPALSTAPLFTLATARLAHHWVTVSPGPARVGPEPNDGYVDECITSRVWNITVEGDGRS